MAPSWTVTCRVLCLLSVFLGALSEKDKPFPKITEIEIEFYQTEVQVTDVNQQSMAYAKEYFDYSQGRGRVEVLAVGSRMSVFYYNETNEILEVNGTTCQTWDIDESMYDYMPMFYGWLNKKPLIVGPSASLWYAQGKATKYEGSEKVRGINCDKFSLPVKGPRDDMMLYYYFADSSWTTPYKLEKLVVPIRVVAIGNSSQDTAKEEDRVPINIITDFAYFKPTISEWRVFQPPEGVGCVLRKATLTRPKIPKVFRFAAEKYDLMKAQEESDSDVEYQQLWYDGVRKIARWDKFTRKRYISEVYDFNTGVTYSNLNDEICTIKPLRDSIFEAYSGKNLVGRFKEAEEVLGLDGETFYYMGKKTIRGVVADVFENVQLDTTYSGESLTKLVTTVYFTQEYMEVAVDGETETRIPIYLLYTGYNDTNTISVKQQFNVFGFSDVIWPDLYSTFQMDRCFPLDDDKSYFVLVMDVKPEIAAQMEGMDDVIIDELRSKCAAAAGVSEMRIPFLRADYKTIGVYVTGLMVNRPPALKQFWMEYEGEVTTHDPDIKPVVEAATKEKCAFACVDENDFTCTGFYFCKEACFLKSRDILDEGSDDDKTITIGESCQTWLRAERDSSNSELYLNDALMRLEYAVLNMTISLNLRLSESETEIIPVQDIIIGEGPYTGQDNVDKPYTTVINYAKLKSEDETTQEVTSVGTLNDCYQACKKSESLSCSSFSYCPDADNKQCMISSVLVVDRQKNPDIAVDDKNCFVYSLKYLDLYEPYPGKVLLISGEETVANIGTAEECAKNCREQKKFQCRGFEFCKSAKSCVLHSKHVLDLGPGDVAPTSKKPQCTHFAARFSADYDDLGYTLIDDDSDKRVEISLEQCAKACSEERKTTCKSFNYCPASEPYATDSTCSLSSKVLADKDATTTTKKKCHHYEKKKNVDDWLDAAKRKITPVSGYSSSGFAGLVIGMLAFGLICGAVLFVAYSYFKSRRSGEGMSVRFMRQET